VLVYRMATGIMPFNGESPYTLMYQHLNELPTPPTGIRPDVSPAVTEVLHRVLAKQPEERYPTVTEFANAFRAALEAQDEMKTAEVRSKSAQAADTQRPNQARNQTATRQQTSTAVSDNAPTLTPLNQPAFSLPVSSSPQRNLPWTLLIVVLIPIVAAVAVFVAPRLTGSPSQSLTPTIDTVATDQVTSTPQLPTVEPTPTFLIEVNPVEAATIAAMSADIAANPDDVDGYFDRGSTFIGDSDCVDAIRDFTRVIELDDQYELAYLSRAYCYSETDEPLLGAADALKYIELHHQDNIDHDPLLPDTPVTLSIEPDMVYRLPVTLTAGQKISLSATASSDSLDPILVLLSPDGTPVIHNDDVSLAQSNFNAGIRNFEVPASGTYTLLVTHAAGGDNGDAEVIFKIMPS
jgi:hypothetical protein